MTSPLDVVGEKVYINPKPMHMHHTGGRNMMCQYCTMWDARAPARVAERTVPRRYRSLEEWSDRGGRGLTGIDRSLWLSLCGWLGIMCVTSGDRYIAPIGKRTKNRERRKKTYGKGDNT